MDSKKIGDKRPSYDRPKNYTCINTLPWKNVQGKFDFLEVSPWAFFHT
jgi:hypothetical protein